MFALVLTTALGGGCAGDDPPGGGDAPPAGGDSGRPDPGSDGGSGDDPPPPSETGLPCDIQATLATQCQSCHGASPRFGAPMPLVTWEDVHADAVSDPSRPVYELMRERVTSESDPMPPPSSGELDDDEETALLDWIDAGAPRGGGDDCGGDATPTPPAGGSGPVALPCEPSHVLQAHADGDTEAPFPVPEDAGNLYMCYPFESPWAASDQATAWAPIVGDERILHHWILYKTSSDKPEGEPFECSTMPADAQFVMGWAPGSGNTVMPDDIGYELPAEGEQLLLQVHYWNVAGHSGIEDRSGVAVCTADSPREQEAGILWSGTLDIEIPPRSRDVQATGRCPSLVTSHLPEPIHVLANAPHMHELGTHFETVVERTDGTTEQLVEVERWDFDNQTGYPNDPPVPIYPGDEIVTTCTYDNPTDTHVSFGLRTEDEMCFDFMMVYPTSALPDERRCVFF